MARAEHGHPDLRASVPTLEPDEAFLARLSELAAGSGASRPPAGVPSLPGWRVGLAAASVAAVVGGLAWLAAAVTGDESPPPSPTPVTQPTDPESDRVGPGRADGWERLRRRARRERGAGRLRRPGWRLRGFRRLGAGRGPDAGRRPGRRPTAIGPGDGPGRRAGRPGRADQGQDHGPGRAGQRAGRARTTDSRTATATRSTDRTASHTGRPGSTTATPNDNGGG